MQKTTWVGADACDNIGVLKQNVCRFREEPSEQRRFACSPWSGKDQRGKVLRGGVQFLFKKTSDVTHVRNIRSYFKELKPYTFTPGIDGHN